MPIRNGEALTSSNSLKRPADRHTFRKLFEEVIPLYDRISRELGISYTLGYLSDKPERDGSYRKIEVVVPGKDYRVSQSRAGILGKLTAQVTFARRHPLRTRRPKHKSRRPLKRARRPASQ